MESIFVSIVSKCLWANRLELLDLPDPQIYLIVVQLWSYQPAVVSDVIDFLSRLDVIIFWSCCSSSIAILPSRAASLVAERGSFNDLPLTDLLVVGLSWEVLSLEEIGTDHVLDSLDGAECRDDPAVESDFLSAAACRGGVTLICGLGELWHWL